MEADSSEEETPSSSWPSAHALDCHLFPQAFIEACSKVSPDRMQKLVEFQEWLIRTKDMINERVGRQIYKQDKIYMLFSSFHWRWELLVHLYHMLQKLQGQLDPAWEDRVSYETESRVSELLAKAGIVYECFGSEDDQESSEDAEDEESSEDESEDIRTVALLINHGRLHYKGTRLQEDAYNLCDSILVIHNSRDLLSANEEPINLSEGDIIKKQIELAERLPTLKVEEEIQNLLAEITPLGGKPHDNVEMANRAIRHIRDTSCDIITIRKTSGIGEEDHKGDRCSVEKTLDSLFHEVDTFKERWGHDYGACFGNFDPAYPKRQGTE